MKMNNNIPIKVGVVFLLFLSIIVLHSIFLKFSNAILFEGFTGFNLSASDLSVYVINLKRNPDRFKTFLELYSKTDLEPIDFIRVDAVDGRKLKIVDLVSEKAYNEILSAEKKGYRTKHYQLTRGAVGCYLSHLNCYKLIRDSNKEYGLIFEDDVYFKTPDMLQELHNNITNLPNDWDIVLLGCICYVCNSFSSYYDVNKFILLHAYIIRKSSATKILNLLDNKPIEQQIDSVYSKMAEEGLLKIYCLKEQLAIQKSENGTTIQIPVKTLPGINPYAMA